MTVQEMIDVLNEVKNKDLRVIVPSGYMQVCANPEFIVEEDVYYNDKYGYKYKAVKIYLGD